MCAVKRSPGNGLINQIHLTFHLNTEAEEDTPYNSLVSH